MIIPKSFHDLLDLNIVFHNERNSNINFLLPRIKNRKVRFSQIER